MLKKARTNTRSPLSRRTKTVSEGYKEKRGGILGQNKVKERKVTSEISENPGQEYTSKTKKRFGRTVTTERSGGRKVKAVTKQDGSTRTKRKEKLLGRAEKTSYAGGGKLPNRRKDKMRLDGGTYVAKDKFNRLGQKVKKTKNVDGSRTKVVTKSDGTGMTKTKEGAFKRAKKTYFKKGGKVVAQGADRADLRAERKQERKEKRGAKAVKRADRKRRNKGYRQLKKDIKTGKLNPYADNMLKG